VPCELRDLRARNVRRVCGERVQARLGVLAGGVDLDEDVEGGRPLWREGFVQRGSGLGRGEGLDGVQVRDGFMWMWSWLALLRRDGVSTNLRGPSLYWTGGSR
jgi:hypothetical protein